MKLALIKSNSPIISQEIAPGWTAHDGSAIGVHRYPNCLRIGNDIAGPGGTVYFDAIEIDFGEPVSIPPRKGWVLSENGTRLTIGSGGECMPPRSSFRVRFAPGSDWRAIFPPTLPEGRFASQLGRTRVPMPKSPVWAEQGQRVAQRFLEALESGGTQSYTGGLIPTLRELGMGLWRPHMLGIYDQANGGGHGIEPIPWERVPEMLLYHDVAMERHAVGWRDRETGEPCQTMTTAHGSYSLARGWMNNACPVEVSEPASLTPYETRRAPKRWNAGECAYEHKLAGVAATGNWANGFGPHDDQHMIRATYRGKVAADVWGDECAKDDLRMIAQDCRYAMPLPVAVHTGYGSGAFGRGWAWCVDAMHAGDMHRHARRLAAPAATAQMPCGAYQRAGYPQPWIPTPWEASATVPMPISTDYDCAATMELVFGAYAMERMGFRDSSIKALTSMLELGTELGYVPKFVAVAKHGAEPLRRFAAWTGSPTYFPWVAIGQLAWTGMRDEAINYALDLPLPSGRQASSKDKLRAMLSDYQEDTGRSQVVAIMSALEDTT